MRNSGGCGLAEASVALVDAVEPVDSMETLARAAAGDSAAFEELVREHQAMVFGLAYHFLHDRPVAEELAQDVFVELYGSLGSIESPAHLKFWLRRVATHRSIDHARRESRRPHVSLDEPMHIGSQSQDGSRGSIAPAGSLASTLAAPASDAADPFVSAKLRQLVATLPEKRRLVVILRYQEELELHEI